MLSWGIESEAIFEEDDEYEEDTYGKGRKKPNAEDEKYSEVKDLTEEERGCLRRFVNKLEANRDKDPKYELVLTLLKEKEFAQRDV